MSNVSLVQELQIRGIHDDLQWSSHRAFKFLFAGINGDNLPAFQPANHSIAAPADIQDVSCGLEVTDGDLLLIEEEETLLRDLWMVITHLLLSLSQTNEDSHRTSPATCPPTPHTHGHLISSRRLLRGWPTATRPDLHRLPSGNLQGPLAS